MNGLVIKNASTKASDDTYPLLISLINYSPCNVTVLLISREILFRYSSVLSNNLLPVLDYSPGDLSPVVSASVEIQNRMLVRARI